MSLIYVFSACCISRLTRTFRAVFIPRLQSMVSLSHRQLTMPGSSPAIQQSLQDWDVCRVALSCHVALDTLYMSMEWQAVERLPRRPKITVCEIVRTHIKVLKAGEQLLHAQPHCEKRACVM